MIKNIRISGIGMDGTLKRHPNTEIELINSKLKEFSMSWIEFVVEDVSSDAEEIVSKLKIQLDSNSVLNGYYSNYEDIGNLLGVTIPLVQIKGGHVSPSPVLIYVSENSIISIHDEGAERMMNLSASSEGFLKNLPNKEGDLPERLSILLARIIDEISERNYDTLRVLVERAQSIELELGSEKSVTAKEVSLEMSKIKRAILTFLSAVWATHTTIHSLRYGDAAVLTDRPELLSRFDIVLDDINRQIQLAEQILELLSTGVNVIQTQLTNRLSTIILWLTVIGTAVLVPNTLATIFAIVPDSHLLFREMAITIILTTIFGSVLSYRAAKRILGGDSTN
ncbi:MAG: CorA family divalent cation transporter [Thermoproteota archaeon]